MARTDDQTAFASNWRAVLAFDAGLGMLVVIAGVATVFAVNVAFGMIMVVVGTAYVAFVGSRARRWLRLRREANL
jgi:hypothetical protein